MPWYRSYDPAKHRSPGLFHWTDSYEHPLCGQCASDRYPRPGSDYREAVPEAEACGCCLRYVKMRAARAEREAAAAQPETDPNQLALFDNA